MNKKRLGDIMFPLFDEYEEYDDIKDALRDLNSYGEVTDDEYDQCLEYWDELLLDWGK